MKLKICTPVLFLNVLLTAFGAALPVVASETAAPQTNAEVMQLAQTGWREYGSERFTIRMPGEPVSSRNAEEVGEGLTLTFNEMTFEDDGGAYGVIYTDLPRNYLQGTNSAAVLDYMSALFLISTQLEGLKEVEQSINLKGHPGLEYRINEAEAALVLRLYLVQERVYFLFGVSEQPNQVNQFVNSFNLR
ncbi:MULTISPECIES: hypothetical protein [Planktothricoides]|uniref:Uncharacterized protein n=1 Tax=Planktothricoides raciborskii FACHB-1370 TaxID=2949576 RepID=A0ABR8EMK6_9CYAN|nr:MULTISPECIES: hypothetical protein [Planktothricoides]KOR38594.1 hypothetical protein AM228_01105 [Planktothricoides sp. SR001]MBD2547557.1 hypothetical protein [Planktothricoides raciborskii FACHB-1370]MBD2586034.1 hypothetical protein [Planktothricoides raciborskii FACHB-1261]